MTGKKILCIEDNPASRLLIRKILKKNGYATFEAEDGLAGVAMAREVLPDLILMDINIPGMDGWECATRIKGIPSLRETPIVALTAQTGEGDRERSLIAGCDGYLRKPVTSSELLQKIRLALGGEREQVSPPAEKQYLREYSHRLVDHLEQKVHELADKNRKLQTYAEKMENVYVGIICSLMNALEQKDRYTAGHSARVTQYAREIGRRMGLSPEDMETLTRAGELHDVGKLIIDLSSINKTGRLSAAEWAKMKEHPAIGAHILSPLTFLQSEVPIVQNHHERWDGRGYPRGIGGRDLGLLTCIVTAADSYDAMTSARVYRPRRPGSDRVLEEMRRCRGSQFHPEVADALVALVCEGALS